MTLFIPSAVAFAVFVASVWLIEAGIRIVHGWKHVDRQ